MKNRGYEVLSNPLRLDQIKDHLDAREDLQTIRSLFKLCHETRSWVLSKFPTYDIKEFNSFMHRYCPWPNRFLDVADEDVEYLLKRQQLDKKRHLTDNDRRLYLMNWEHLATVDFEKTSIQIKSVVRLIALPTLEALNVRRYRNIHLKDFFEEHGTAIRADLAKLQTQLKRFEFFGIGGFESEEGKMRGSHKELPVMVRFTDSTAHHLYDLLYFMLDGDGAGNTRTPYKGPKFDVCGCQAPSCKQDTRVSSRRSLGDGIKPMGLFENRFVCEGRVTLPQAR